MKSIYAAHYDFLERQVYKYSLVNNTDLIERFAKKNTFSSQKLCTYFALAHNLESLLHGKLLASALFYKIIQSSYQTEAVEGIGLTERYTPSLLNTLQRYLLHRWSFHAQKVKLSPRIVGSKQSIEDDNDQNTYVFAHAISSHSSDIINQINKDYGVVIGTVPFVIHSCVARKGVEKIALVDDNNVLTLLDLLSKKYVSLSVSTKYLSKISFNPYQDRTIGLLYFDKILIWDIKQDSLIKKLSTDQTSHFVFKDANTLIWQDKDKIHLYDSSTNKKISYNLDFIPLHWHYHSESNVLVLTDKTTVFFYKFDDQAIRPLWFEQCQNIGFLAKIVFSPDGNIVIVHNPISISLFNIALHQKKELWMKDKIKIDSVIVDNDHLFIVDKDYMITIHAPIFSAHAKIDLLIEFIKKARCYSPHLSEEKWLKPFLDFIDYHPEQMFAI